MNLKKNNIEKTIHAEEMAIDKLKTNNRKTQLVVSLLVIRITQNSNIDNYKLCNSKPCASCISKITGLNIFGYSSKNVIRMSKAIAGYKISKIYYSNEDGEIIFFKINNFLKEKLYISRYYRNSLSKLLIKEFNLSDKIEANSNCSN